MTYVDTLGQQAKVASRQIAKLSTAAKNDLLNQVAKALVAESDYIITENAKDMANASAVSYTHLDVYERQLPLSFQTLGKKLRSLELQLVQPPMNSCNA